MMPTYAVAVALTLASIVAADAQTPPLWRSSSVRRIKLAIASSYPWQNEFALAHLRLQRAAG